MINSTLLINGIFFGFTQRYLKGSEVLNYWISPNTPTGLIIQIERVLLKIDTLLDLDLQRTSAATSAVVQIAPGTGSSSVDPVTGIRSNVIGRAVPSDERWIVEWAPSGEDDLRTLVHELGHVLGLGHPNPNDPFDQRFNTADTVMSYNRNPSNPGSFYTAADLNALTGLWGPEDDPVAVRPAWVTPGSDLEPEASLAASLQAAIDNADQTALINSAYWLTLGRAPDPGGLNHWQQELAAGLGRRTLVEALLLSEEATQLMA